LCDQGPLSVGPFRFRPAESELALRILGEHTFKRFRL
jgi:hypothetical protein